MVKLIIREAEPSKEHYEDIIRRISERYFKGGDTMPIEKQMYYKAKFMLINKRITQSKNPEERRRLSKKSISARNKMLEWCSALEFGS